jgi:XTP/dITP diphosphohydrolase
LSEGLRIVLATGNLDKVREIRALLEGIALKFLSLEDFPDLEPAVEDGLSFEENAIKKALHVSGTTGEAVLADDSGLEVEALDGDPGVRSARFAGEPSDHQANNRKLLELLKGVPEEKRKAAFVCVAVLVTPRGKVVVQRGELKGRITTEPRGRGGFGYDPVFYIPRLRKTVAELDEAAKNEISHRGQAFTALKPFIMSLTPPSRSFPEK